MKMCNPICLFVALILFAMPADVIAQDAAAPDKLISQLEAAVGRRPFDSTLRIQLGIAYMDRDDLPHALEAFQEGVQLAPTSAEAHNWLGVARMAKADLPGAVVELRKAVELDPKFARGYTNLGSALARSGDNAGSVEAFEKALVLEPENPTAHMNLALALRSKGDLKGALVHLRRVEKDQTDNASVEYELGQTLRQAGDLPGAVAAFEKSIQINPELQEGYYGLGQALKRQSAAVRRPAPAVPSDALKRAQETAAKGDLNAARDQLLEILRTDETNAQAHILLGFILGQQGQLEFAVNHLQRAVQLQPDAADAHYNLGMALWYSGAREKAVPELEESVRLDPASGVAQAFLGMALRERGDLAKAQASLQRAIALLPPTTSTYVDLAIVFLRAGQLDRALGQFEAGLNAPSDVPTPDWDGAIAGLREASSKNPKRADIHNMLGLVLGRKGVNSQEVIAELQAAVKLRPDYAAAHNNLGLVYAQSDEDEKAIAEFREALRTSPNYADAHANLGATLMPTDNEQAVQELEKAVLLNTASVKAQFNLAEAYGTNPKYGGAKQIEQLRKVIAMSPELARAHLSLGKALLAQGKDDEAVSELREAVRLDSKSGEAHYQLGLALARSGKQQDATAELGKGRELAADSERTQNADLDVNEGRAALDKGQLDQAIEKFRHASKLKPDSAPAQYYLGVSLEKKGDLAEAEAAYQKTLDLDASNAAARQALDRLRLPEAPKSATSAGNVEVEDSTRVSELEGYIRENRFAEVEPLLTDYVGKHPKSDWGWYALGYSQFAQKKIGESIKSLSRALQLNLSNAEAHKILGRDLMIIGRFDAAQIEFEQGIRYEPQSAEMHYNLGKLFSIQDSWENARRELDAALSIDPSYIDALDALGFAQEALGDDASAVKSYDKAIALNEERHGTFVSPYVNLSAYYNRTGENAKALDWSDKALGLDSKSDAAWFQKSRAQERNGQLAEAVNSLNQAITLNARSSSYYYVLAGLYRRLGKMEESQKALDSFTRLDRENNELDKMRRGGMARPVAERPGGGRE
jgi:tetratricopeptide (TPR) repeat protein